MSHDHPFPPLSLRSAPRHAICADRGPSPASAQGAAVWRQRTDSWSARTSRDIRHWAFRNLRPFQRRGSSLQVNSRGPRATGCRRTPPCAAGRRWRPGKAAPSPMRCSLRRPGPWPYDKWAGGRAGDTDHDLRHGRSRAAPESSRHSGRPVRLPGSVPAWRCRRRLPPRQTPNATWRRAADHGDLAHPLAAFSPAHAGRRPRRPRTGGDPPDLHAGELAGVGSASPDRIPAATELGAAAWH